MSTDVYLLTDINRRSIIIYNIIKLLIIIHTCPDLHIDIPDLHIIKERGGGEYGRERQVLGTHRQTYSLLNTLSCICCTAPKTTAHTFQGLSITTDLFTHRHSNTIITKIHIRREMRLIHVIIEVVFI